MQANAIKFPLVLAILIFSISPLFAIEIYRSQEMQVYSGKSSEMHPAREIPPSGGQAVEGYQAPSVEEYQGARPSQPDAAPLRETMKSAAKSPSLPVNLLGSRNVQCETREGIMPGLTTVEISGDFPARAGEGLLLTVIDLQSKKITESRKVGIETSGRLQTDIAIYKYAAAPYGFVITPANDPKTILASGKFSIGNVVENKKDRGTSKAAPERSTGSRAATPSASSVAGTWYGTASTVGTIVLKADGTYEYGGGNGGRYALESGGIKFTGRLAAWNDGHATLKNGNLEFTWTTVEGWHQWFSFAR